MSPQRIAAVTVPHVAVSTRRGTRDHNADATAIRITSDLAVAAIVDGIGNSTKVAHAAQLAADVTARIAARYGGLAGILTAGALLADDDPDGPEPDAVALVAVADPDSTVIHWIGDCRAYGLTGGILRQYTTDHTVGQQLRVNGLPADVAEDHDNWVRTTLSRAVVATVYEVVIPAERLVVLTTDGVHDSITGTELTALVLRHQNDLQTLADTITGAVQPDSDGYRDDATVIALAPAGPHP